MRAYWALCLLVAASGCTQYQPVAWDGRGSWAQARAAANQPAKAGTEVAAATHYRGKHVVEPGETLSGLAVRYGTPIAALAEANRVKRPYTLVAGQVLAVPATASRAAPVPAAKAPPRPIMVAKSLLPPSAQSVQVASLAPIVPVIRSVALDPPEKPSADFDTSRLAAQKTPPPLSGDGFMWPVRGQIASAFGPKSNGARNDGINIRAAEGTPVLAAENGIVVYAGDEIRGYGRMLLISHADGFTTAYAHNQALMVAVGAEVSRGQPIATVGRTGDVNTPQLHFELRDGKEPIDPVAHLDSARTRIASAS